MVEPTLGEEIDIVVPEFNEFSRQGERFDRQIAYLSRISRSHDTFLVDDASTDGSWERIVETAPKVNPRLHLVKMKENGQKVLAIKQVLERCRTEYVVLSDFDSTLATPETVSDAVRRFERDPLLAAVAFRLVPEGSSVLSKLQDIEYAVERKVFGGYLVRQGKLRCVPGAAGIWRKRILQEVLEEHSGRHNGDDFEATAIALRKGYRFEYERGVVVNTMVPQNARDFFKQRKRWALGCLETYDKERRFFRGQIKNLKNRLGHVTIFDGYTWFSAIATPFFLANALLNHFTFGISFSIGFALSSLMCYVSRDEVKDKRELALVPFFPIYIFLATMPFIAALYGFLGAKKSRGDQVFARPRRPIGMLCLDDAGVPVMRSTPRKSRAS